MAKYEAMISAASIEQCIFMIRENNKVILGNHLAELHAVAAWVLMEAVKGNIERIAENFMFQITDEEIINLKS
ncbi:MAG: ORF6N domain-containing protein [Candidatus Aureabacteria bacterium]|nr:ORF6N domain-containing protein [Candidatus Auribacterota bacterium]